MLDGILMMFSTFGRQEECRKYGQDQGHFNYGVGPTTTTTAGAAAAAVAGLRVELLSDGKEEEEI